MKPEILALAVVVTAANLMPYLRREAWWIRIFDFPRLQVLALSLCTLGLCLLNWHDGTWRMWGLLGLVGAAAFSQIYSIFPYTPLRAKRSCPPRCLGPNRPFLC